MSPRPQLVVDNETPQRNPADLFGWLQAVTTDAKLGHFAVRVAVALSAFFDRNGGYCWPTQETLANRIGATPRGVRNALDELTAAGHLEVIEQRGRTHTNRYRPIMEKRNDGSSIAAENRNHGSGISSDNRNDGSSFEGVKPEPLFHKTGTAVPPEPIRQDLEDKRDISPPLSPKRPKRQNGEVDPEFDRFWQQYPRKVSRGAARKAWETAVRRAEVPAILAAVMRYAAERDGQDPRYTKHPATWLNSDCWLDEPAPPALAAPMSMVEMGARMGAMGRDATDQAVDAMLRERAKQYRPQHVAHEILDLDLEREGWR